MFPRSNCKPHLLLHNNRNVSYQEIGDADKAAALITSGKIRVDPQTEPAGSYFTFTIPSLKPFIQEDGTVTLMLSTMTGRHKVLVLSAREHESFAGPLLTFETQERDVK